MSLLIKALDHLEKEKAKSADSKSADQRGKTEALSVLEALSLVPIDEPLPAGIPFADTITEVGNANSTDDSPTDDSSSDDELKSLAEEAGLTDSAFNLNKYEKPKTSAAQKKSPNNATLNKVAEPVATSKNQADALKNSVAAAPTKKTKPAVVTPPTDTANQEAAAKVFVANKAANTSTSKFALAMISVAGAVALWLGWQGYNHYQSLNAPVVMMKPRPSLPPPADTAVAENPPKENGAAPATEQTSSALSNHADKTDVESIDADAHTEKVPAKKTQSKSASEAKIAGADESTQPAPRKASKKTAKNVQLISRAPSSGVDPTLQGAYQDYVRGDNSSAQWQYRQVLQRDVHNIDALLGMAAIAQRQGRDADAAGWYQKVLDIDPKNAIAQSASISPQAGNDVVSVESRIKNMLAQQPDSASLHAALGNFYAEQNQWPAAQEAYFNASRLSPSNADYAFNLAISLDQMTKADLALKQYQRALDLLNKSGGRSPDRAQLEARIKALQ